MTGKTGRSGAPENQAAGAVRGRTRWLAAFWVVGLVATAASLAGTAAAAPMTPEQVAKITPVPALRGVAACVREFFDPGARPTYVEQQRIEERCRTSVDRIGGLLTLTLVNSDEIEWTECGYALASDGYTFRAPPNTPMCGGKFTLNEAGTHFQFAVWSQGNHTRDEQTVIAYTFMPMVETNNGFTSLTQAGRDYWETSPWAECNLERTRCNLIATPPKPAVDRP